jgi:hypothetical protein
MMQHSTVCVCTTNIKWATFLFLLRISGCCSRRYSLTSLWWSHQNKNIVEDDDQQENLLYFDSCATRNQMFQYHKHILMRIIQ